MRKSVEKLMADIKKWALQHEKYVKEVAIKAHSIYVTCTVTSISRKYNKNFEKIVSDMDIKFSNLKKYKELELDVRTKSNPTKSRGAKAGKSMADSLIELAHLMYNNNTAKRVIKSVIKRLEERVEEYKPVKKGAKK